MNIELPYNYEPRTYQLPFLEVFDKNINDKSGKIRKFVKVWHRRAGKEKTDIAVVSKQMQLEKGAYYYFFPTYNQGKKILWEGMDKSGFRFIDHFPKQLLQGKPNDTEMKLKYKNNSLFQVIGTENINSIVGTNPRGCVFSEYSLQDPRAWDYMRPILAENGGWAAFNFTPRGENHGKELLNLAQDDPDNWWWEILTVEDTKAIPKEVLEQERKEIIRLHGNDALYQQEYMCSFTAPIPGAYYASQLMQATNEGRLCNVPHEQRIPVDTYWDLGIDDSMTIGFFQVVGKEIRIIDYVECQGEGLPYYINILQNKGYVYGEHYAPHDIQVRELSSGKSRLEMADSMGLRFKIAPKLAIEDGIHAVRMIFNNLWINNVKCKRLVDALKSYHKEYDEKNKIYKNHPEHDWSSHAADMLRTFATSFNFNKMNSIRRQSPLGLPVNNIDKNSVSYANVHPKSFNRNYRSLS